jgi:probable HAF family extracellular repeat protein
MKRRRVKPMLELLEDRLVLSATITDLGVLPGYVASEATGINSSGQVVGVSTTNSSSGHAFLYSSGQLTDLGPAVVVPVFGEGLGINNTGQVVGGSSFTSGGQAFLYSNSKTTALPLDTAVAINDNGQIAGEAKPSANSAEQAALYSNGTVTALGSLSSITHFSVATAINASGQVVGFSDSPTFDNGGPNTENAFLYSNDKMTDLGTLSGDSSSSAFGINDSGQVVGASGTTEYADPTSGTHAFLYSNQQMIDLGTLPNDTWSIAYGINSSGQVVGESGVVNSNSSITSRAFLYSNNQMIDLNSLLPANSGWELTDATAINDSGEIVGDGTINGQAHAFLLNLNVSLSPASLPDGIVNNSYTQAITANGGIGDKTLTYTVTSGAIPDGLTFTPKTNELDIGGTPTAAGTVTFTVKATDSATPSHSVTQTYTLTTSAAVAPVITANPSNQSVTVGQTATFTASASGNPTPTAQWQLSIDGGKTWTNVNLPSSTTIILPNVPLTDNGAEVRAVFTNSAGSVTTNAATLTVTAIAQPTTPPTSPSSPTPPSLNVPPLLTFIDSLLAGIETVNADGTATVTDSLFGFPLLVATFDASGNLESVILFGIDVTLLFELL